MGKVSELHMDIGRLPVAPFTNRQRLSAAALIGECEAIVECGLLPEQNEQSLRLLIADALSAFGMQHNDFENNLELTRTVMEQS